MNSNNKLVQDIFKAYYGARKNKRNKLSTLEFDIDYERNLFELADEIWQGKYRSGPSTCFIVDKPVKREIFAAQFRDRIVHHLIFNQINPIFERKFINDSYSCRVGKGTLYGIRRLDHFIRSCSENYQKDCYILKLDLKGYFMSINKQILYSKIDRTLNRERERERESNRFAPETGKLSASREIGNCLMRELIQKTVFYDPTADYVVKGEKRKWAGLPKSKSLFYSRLGRGLPIGNLTSQLFANIYLNDFDHFVKRNLKIRYYGRYVDDMALVHQDKNHLKSIIPSLSDYLKNNLQLELHEKKIYLQHYAKGVKFLGAFIMPHRVYIDKRTKGNLHNLIRESNLLLEKQNNQIDWNQTKEFTVGLNSYLGLMGHFQTDKLQRAVIKELSVYLWNYVYMERGYLKIR